MKTATVVGYHGRRNLGDDMFLRISAEWLARLGVERLFVAGLVGVVPTSIAGLKVHPFERRCPIARFVWLQIFVYGLRSSVLLFAAGSIFTVQPFLLAYVILRALLLLKPKLQLLAVGVSIGPFRNRFDAYWCGKLLALFHRIIVRDRQSLEIVQPQGEGVAPIVGYDLGLLWRPEVSRDHSVDGPVIGICLNALNNGSTREVEPADRVIAEALAAARAFAGVLRVIVLVICSDERDGDTVIGTNLASLLRKRDIAAEIRTYRGRHPEQFIAHLSECDAIIASRMHAGVFAMMQAIPVFQIAYARKIIDLFQHCGLEIADVVAPAELTQEAVRDFVINAISGRLRNRAERRRERLFACGDIMAEAISSITLAQHRGSNPT